MIDDHPHPLVYPGGLAGKLDLHVVALLVGARRLCSILILRQQPTFSLNALFALVPRILIGCRKVSDNVREIPHNLLITAQFRFTILATVN
jgi:hypothetical protein